MGFAGCKTFKLTKTSKCCLRRLNYVIYVIWPGQASSKWIPKIFFVLTLSIAWPLCITLNNSLLFKLCFWLSWVVENSINLVLSSLKTKLLFDDTVSRPDSNSSRYFFDFSVLNVLYRVESSVYCNE